MDSSGEFGEKEGCLKMGEKWYTVDMGGKREED